jgi:hypothetical protein
MPDLNAGGQATLASIGGIVTATVTVGPGRNGDRGPATWNVTGVIVKSSRPGRAPIPRVEVFQDDGLNPLASQGVTYDGSFSQGGCNINLVRGQALIATWTGGQVGDTVYLVVSGTKQ